LNRPASAGPPAKHLWIVAGRELGFPRVIPRCGPPTILSATRSCQPWLPIQERGFRNVILEVFALIGPAANTGRRTALGIKREADG
jgi:hypothetical protein